jgi:tetraacyldisaccharide 4'-kinase
MTYIVMIICYLRAICARVERCKRAKVVIITKCPSGLAIEEQDSIRMKLNLDKAKNYTLVLSSMMILFSEHDSITLEKIRQPKLLVAGIAKPDSF